MRASRAGDALCARMPPYATEAVLMKYAPSEIEGDAHCHSRSPIDVDSILSPTNVEYSVPSLVSSPVDDPVREDSAKAVIGLVLLIGKLSCVESDCAGLTFGRQAELRRHYHNFHAAHKSNFWCPVSACSRSAVAGAKPFLRKDKLKDHIKSVHWGVIVTRPS